MMEKIKSDDLLVKILSFLPTKDAITTSVLSKRWEFLWMWVPKLEFDDSNMSEMQRWRMQHYVDRNLPLHRAPVIESLHLNLSSRSFHAEAIKFLVVNAVFRSVHELSVRYLGSMKEPNALLPSNLYICKSLVALKLEGKILVDVPRMVCLLSLKTLILGFVRYTPGSLQRLLFSCPVLEDLNVERRDGYCGEALRVFIPSLQRLTIKITSGCHYSGFVINTPSLKYFKFTDDRIHSDSESYTIGSDEDEYVSRSYFIENMPQLEEAYLDFEYSDIESFIEDFIRQFTSVKRLSLCVQFNNEEALYGEGIVFNKLEDLKICSCQSNWRKLLVRLLKDCPNLLELEVYNNDHSSWLDPSVCWHNLLSDVRDDHSDRYVDQSVWWNNQLSDVPGCLLWSLQTFKWRGFYGSREKLELVKYILRNACCLKSATITCVLWYNPKKKLEMIEELSLSSRGSTSCHLAFD